MGIMDAFDKEDRTQVTVSQLYTMLREAAKCELVMNAVNCDVPHTYIREMATGEYETPEMVNRALSKTVKEWMDGVEEAARVRAENIE